MQLKRISKVSLIGAIRRTSCPNSREKLVMSPAKVIGRIHSRQPHAEPLMLNIFLKCYGQLRYSSTFPKRY